MREYLDRSIDAHWDENPQKTTEQSEEEVKLSVGTQYIELRGVCKAHNIWFEDAVGTAYQKMKENE